MFLETSDPPIFCAHNLSSAPLTFSEKRKLSLAVRVDSRAIGSGIYAISAATGTLGTEALHPIGHVFLARARFSIPLSLRVFVCGCLRLRWKMDLATTSRVRYFVRTSVLYELSSSSWKRPISVKKSGLRPEDLVVHLIQDDQKNERSFAVSPLCCPAVVYIDPCA